MQLSSHGLALVKRFEGFSPKIYLCPAGIPTIGYGHVVRDAGDYASGIDEKEAERLLRADVRMAELAVARLISAPLKQGQFDALVSFTFNLGAGRLQMATLRRKVNAGEHEAVPSELMRWVFSNGKRLPGLVFRRFSECKLYQGFDFTELSHTDKPNLL